MIVPLAFLFDWVRKMFESAKAIREAKKAEIREKAIQEGLQEGLREGMKRERERIKRVLETSGVELPPGVYEDLVRESSSDDS